MDSNQLFEQIKKKESFLCVGLDTDIKKIPACLLSEENPVFSFNKAIIDATAVYTVYTNPISLFTKYSAIRDGRHLSIPYNISARTIRTYLL